MNVVSNPEVTTTFEHTIQASDLLTAFEHYANKIKILSLDCFDTILWRQTATPTDLFYDLQNQPAYKALGFTAAMRTRAEANARRYKTVQKQISEVSLDEIYLTAFPSLNTQQLTALAEEELAAEIQTCYAFPRIIELMRQAINKNIKIIIVSDTYLNQKQLKQLLAAHLPQDVITAIDAIFCSSEYSFSKIDGLFKHVLDKQQQQANQILHIGDNLAADYLAAKAFKLHALHFVHYDSQITNILQLQEASARITDPTIRRSRALHNAFRGVLANNKISLQQPESQIGYASLGPMMYAFIKFLRDDIHKMKQTGKSPKILFLMRDAYLPFLIYNTLETENPGTCIRISRFATLAASFQTQADVDEYIADNANSFRFHDICRQLLLPDTIADPLVQQAYQAGNYSIAKFIELIHAKNILEIIFKKSAEYQARLITYLIKEINLTAGDTLLFVDLGYSGTTQTKFEPIFRKKLNVEIIGRYFLSLSVPGWESSRNGLLNPSWCDENTMLAYVKYIALLEQLCTANECSIVDYDNTGNPIFSDTRISKEQHTKLSRIQAECVRFVVEAEEFFQKTKCTFPITALRDTALAELGRLLFLPSENEIHYLKSFQFDLNVGTDDIYAMFDLEKSITSLRRRGILYPSLEKSDKAVRTNYPAELRAAGIELSLMLMAQRCFDIKLNLQNLNFRKEQIDIIIKRGNEVMQTKIEATFTYDGYFALYIPVGTGNLQIGVLFGKQYQWVEIESTDLIKANACLTQYELKYTSDCSANIVSNQMENRGKGLYECTSESGLLMLASPLKPDNKENYIFRIVFRPIVKR